MKDKYDCSLLLETLLQNELSNGSSLQSFIDLWRWCWWWLSNRNVVGMAVNQWKCSGGGGGG